MNRKLKKYNLKYEYLKLEEEEVREVLDSYIDDFEDRFNKYYATPPSSSKKDREVWVNEETGEVRDTPPPFDDFFKDYEQAKKQAEESEKRRKERIEELKGRPEKVKKLYKKLAAKVHPDLGGSNELFQNVNKLYEENNLMSLLVLAGEYDISYEVDDSDSKVLEKNLTEIENEINRMKSTLAWAWGVGDVKTRKNVVKEVERQTGWKVDPEVLPDDLKPKDETPKLLEE